MTTNPRETERGSRSTQRNRCVGKNQAERLWAAMLPRIEAFAEAVRAAERQLHD